MEPVLTSARSTYIPSALSNTAYRNSLLGIGSDKIYIQLFLRAYAVCISLLEINICLRLGAVVTMTFIKDFNRRNFDSVSEPLKFRKYLYFRQIVRSAECLFGEKSVRQNVRSTNYLNKSNQHG